MRTERPPEGWLVKAWDRDAMVDLIYGADVVARTAASPPAGGFLHLARELGIAPE